MLAFSLAFLFASLVATATYWGARRPWAAMFWGRIGLSFLALAVILDSCAVSVQTHDFSSVLPLIVALVLSGIQALIERSLEGEDRSLKSHWIRAFSTSLCTFFILFAIVKRGSVVLGNPSLLSNPLLPVWSRAFFNGLLGFVAAWIVAPLSLSFYRHLFQTIHLRPGLDRLLCDDELAG